jgi:murein DD-endopeptidase MepM/ murein hydrolase activator NlpD
MAETAVRAQVPAETTTQVFINGDDGNDTDATQRVEVRVGRALDLEGRPVYAGRSTFSSTASVTTFSLRRPRSPEPVGRASVSSSLPLAYSALTSGFGMRRHPMLGGLRMHSGVDLAAPTGSAILASRDGVVGKAGWNGGYGLSVSLVHGQGLETRYGHMSKIDVAVGQAVRKGDIIGHVGSTGRSTGPHLHFEMRMNGVAIRPRLEPIAGK